MSFIEEYKLLTRVLDRLTIGAFIIDSKGSIVYTNSAMLKMLGISKKVLNGVDFFSISNDERLNYLIMDGLKGKEFSYGPVKCSFSIGGRKIFGLFVGIPISNGFLLIAVENKTDELLMKRELKSNLKRIADILNSSKDWVWEIDKEGKYTFSSDKVKTILGYSPEEVIGRSPFDFIDKERSPDVEKKFDKILQKREPIVNLENWNIRKDGKRVCLLTNGVPIFDIDGNFAGYRGVDRDITKEKIMYNTIKENERKYKLINDNIRDIILLFDDKHSCIFVNKAIELYGFKYDEVIGHNYEKIASMEFLIKKVRSLIGKRRRHFVFEATLRDKKGNSYEFEIKINRIKMEKGYNLLVILSDITERKRLQSIEIERELERRKSKAEKELEMLRTELLSMIAHELNQPLTPIIGYSQILLSSARKEETKNYLTRILSNARHMRDLVRKIINLIKLESNKLTLRFDDIDLKQVLEEAIKDKESFMKLKKIKISKSLISATVKGDYNVLKDIFINLLDNAIKFSKEGGTIEVKMLKKESRVFVSVIDQGIGIKKEDLPHIFEKFYRSKDSRVKEGFGIGLALCKHFVELHKGTISVESKYGKGSEFIVSLPIKKE